MGFFDDLEETDDDGQILDPTYLDKKSPGDYVLELDKVKQDQHADDGSDKAGEEFLLAVFTVRKEITGQADITGEGEKVSYFLPMYSNVGKNRKRHMYREIAEFLSAALDKPAPEVIADLKADGEKALVDMVDDIETGEFFRASTKPPKNGWHNWEFKKLDEGTIDVAA